MRKNSFLPVTLLIAVASMFSCVDNNYDLNDVDFTLGTNANLTLPTCSTGDILLRNIMDLKEDGIIQVVPDPSNPSNEIFVVKQSGSANIDPIKINKVEISKPALTPFEATVNLRELLAGSNAPSRKRISAVINGQTINIADQTFNYDIKDGEAHQNITGAAATNISADVVNIERVKFNDVTATLTLKTTGFPSYIPKMHLDNLTISLPRELKVTRCSLNGVDAKSIQPGLIQITDVLDPARDTNDQILKITVSEAETGENFTFDGKAHKAQLKGAFDVKGTFRIETSEMKTSEMEAIIENVLSTWSLEEKLAFAASPNLTKIDGLIPVSLNFKGTTQFDKDLTLTHVTGDFQHMVNNIDPIKLNDLPRFLNNDDVVLDLDNPMVFIHATSQLPAVAATSLTLSNDLDPNTKYNHQDQLLIKGNGLTTDYYLASKAETKYIPQEYAGVSPTWLRTANLGNIIKKIPNQINVSVEPVTMHVEDMDITRPYDISVDYDVFAPLAFGSQFYLVYEDSERDWDLDDVDGLDAKLIELEAKVTSTLPADIRFTVLPIDENGNRIPQLLVDEIGVTANATNQSIKLQIKAAQGYTVNDALAGKNGVKQLDGITYRAVIDNPLNHDALPSTSKIKLSDIKLTIKGQVTYDAN